MASASTEISLGVFTSTSASSARSASIVVSVGALCTAAPYAASDGINTAQLTNLKSWLPSQRVPLVDKNGLMSLPWYKFFEFVANIKLGGPAAPTVTDLSNNVISVKADAVAANATAAAVATQTAANAIALEATKQVVVNNSLAGSTQIPPVTLGNVYTQNDYYSNISGE